SATLRIVKRRHPGNSVADERHSVESEEIPADQIGLVLKRLVVNADDFGFTADVNEGIVEAHRNGILTATTLMANGDAFDDAARRAAAVPALDVGCHFVLVGGRSLLPPYKPLPASVPELLAAIVSRQIRIRDELSAQ